MKLKSPNGVVPFSAACLAAMIAGLIYVSYTADQRKAALERAAEVKQRCGRLRLRMTREEAVELMGQPIKEYNVRPLGKAGPALFEEMLFDMPLSTLPAYVDLDLETSRVVEIYCNQGYDMALPISQRDLLKAEQNSPLPSDRSIPSAR